MPEPFCRAFAVTVGAPGVQITSTWIGDSLAEVRTLSGARAAGRAVSAISRLTTGTSASAPHVAGVMALLAGTASTPLSPKQMKELVQLTATANVLKNVPENTPNLLVYNSPPDGKEAYGL